MTEYLNVDCNKETLFVTNDSAWTAQTIIRAKALASLWLLKGRLQKIFEEIKGLIFLS
jgi:hypothetical protein